MFHSSVQKFPGLIDYKQFIEYDPSQEPIFPSELQVSDCTCTVNTNSGDGQKCHQMYNNFLSNNF